MKTTVNENFQAYLIEKCFSLNTTKQEEGYLYQGRLQVSEQNIIDFALQIQDGTEAVMYQIVYNFVAFCDKKSDKEKWLKAINEINSLGLGVYYLCLDEFDRVFARHIGIINQDMDALFNTLTMGGNFIRQVIPELTQRVS